MTRDDFHPFTVQIPSDIDRDIVVAEIWNAEGEWDVEYDAFLAALQRARERLGDPPPQTSKFTTFTRTSRVASAHGFTTPAPPVRKRSPTCPRLLLRSIATG